MQDDQKRPSHACPQCWGKSHGDVEVLRGRMGEHGVAVAATVVDDPIRSPSDGDGGLYHELCPSLYHGLGLDLCLCPGLFLGLQGLWRLSTDLSTADSCGTQPCNLLYLHLA